MAMMKTCKCGVKIDYFTKCCTNCVTDQKARTKQYDKKVRRSEENEKFDKFYKSIQWSCGRKVAIDHYYGLDIYSYYVRQKIEQGKAVHHVIPLKDDWNKRVELSNLIYLTDANHALIERSMMSKDKEATIKMINGLIDRFNVDFD